MIAALPVPAPYSLERTLRSGQCFRWVLTPRGARGVVGGSVVWLRQRPEGLLVRCGGSADSPRRLLRYLGADRPLAAVEGALARERPISRLLPHTSGIGIMRQDPWECLVSFVVSAFNNIPKIRMSIQALARCFGEPIADGGAAGSEARPVDWTFPCPARLAEASLPALRRCALGYRARYVRDLARLVADRTLDLDALSRLPLGEARSALLELPGVGEKVAECVLLFGLGHDEAFPVDVWVRRAVERWYFHGRSQTPRAIGAWARERFGALAGYAQQHLFVGARWARLS
ncbi:MAG: DNA glycosylase [Armatimonadota bacterium]|nr:DNA glycosylase [Armatimonadota bacterium]